MSRQIRKASHSAIDRAVALALLACAAGAGVGHAANFTCTLTQSGNWASAANWSGCNGGAGYPNNAGGSTFDAIIESGVATLQSDVTFGNASVGGSGNWQIYNGATASLTGALNVSGSGLIELQNQSALHIADSVTLAAAGASRLKVDAYGGSGGSQVSIGGNLVNQSSGATYDGGVSVGNANMTLADALSVTGGFTNTGGITDLTGGSIVGATARMTVGGAAPSTVTGTYNLTGNAGGAVLQWGSGGMTQIGDGGANAGAVVLHGANAYLEVGPTNSNSALTGLTSIASNGLLDLRDGETVNVAGTLTVMGGGSGRLKVDGYGGCCSYGGSAMTIGGNLINQSTGLNNDGGVSLGEGQMTHADSLAVQGSLTNTGAILNVTGGVGAGDTARMTVGGAAPSTVTGTYNLTGNKGGAVLQWGSGGITHIGDGGANAGTVFLHGANAYLEVGPTNSNSALTGLTSIASNGLLDLRDGETVNVAGTLTVMGGGSGRLKVDGYGGCCSNGGSAMTIGGNLINQSTGFNSDGGVSLGEGQMSNADSLAVQGSLTNTGGILNVTGGAVAGATARMTVAGAAPGTLTGQYDLVGNAGGASLTWGSGGITQIGDGSANSGNLYINGANAYAEVGVTNSNSALTGLTSIASNGQLDLRDGAVVSTSGPLTVVGGGNAGGLKVDYNGGAGGSQVTVGGNLINQSNGFNGNGGVDVGSGQMSNADSLAVHGSLTNTGAVLNVTGGAVAGATARVTVAGAAPGTLTGQYDLVGNAGGASLTWGSGGITQIGDGGANSGNLYLDGANAYAEVGATNSNSALTGLTSIASNGQLDLRDGAVVSTSGPLTVVGGGNAGGLKVDYYGGAGGSQVTVGGNLINQSNGVNGNGGVDVGNGGMTQSDLLTIDGELTNASGATLVVQGNTGANATGKVLVNGAASNAATVLINGGGELTVADGNPYTQSAGFTSVNGTLTAAAVNNQGGSINGTGTIIGAVTNAATISGGVNGQLSPLNIDGSLTNTASGMMASYESASPATATEIAITGSLALQGGTLQANAVNGLTFAPGQAATVATFTPGAMSGMFEYLQNAGGAQSTHPTYLDLGNGTTLDVNYNVNSGNVELTTVATPTNTAEAWNGGAGTWSTGSDWSSGAAPLSYSDVSLGSSTASSVVLNQDATINSLAVQGGNDLQFQAGAPAALTIGQNVVVSSAGVLALGASGDRMTAGGTISNAGTLSTGTGSVVQVMDFGGAGTAINNTGVLDVGGTVLSTGALSNAAGATVALLGGTVATHGYVNAGTTSGHGTITPAIDNSGTLTASGGTLNVNGGFTGAGTVQTAAGGTLSLGANSTAGMLVNDGALALNEHSITVTSSYQNGSAGVGNAFDSRAGVSGTGQIVAAGASASTAETIAVNGGTPTAGNAVINFGNVRVGESASQTYVIGNDNSGGPQLSGAIQTAANGASITDSRLSGGGVTAQNWGPVPAGGETQNYAVTFDASSAGALSGQTLHVLNDFGNTNSQNISILGAAYQAASGQLNNTAAHPDTFSFGTIQVGQTVTSNALSISNAATGASGYVEDLNASFGTVASNGGTGGASIVGNGSISGLLAGATNTSAMSVSVTGTQAGTVQSGIGVNFYTAGTVDGQSDGLGSALVGAANVPVDGTIQASVNVVNSADPVVNNAPITLGNVRQNATSPTADVSVTNQSTETPQAALDASISGDSAVSAAGNFSGLSPGSTNDTALQVGLNTSNAGHVSGLATLNLISDASNIGGCGTHCTMNLPAQQVAVSGNVYRLADPIANTTAVVLAARVGDSAPTAAISVSNVSPDQYTEGLAATLGTAPGGWTRSGSISNLAAGATDASSLQVGLSTATAGVFKGNESVNFVSNGLIDNAQAVGVGSASVQLQGDVYTTAVEHVGTAAVNFGVVHVGQAVTHQSVSVSNTAAQSALNDSLLGQLGMQSGSASAFSTSGSLGAGIAAGQTDSSGLSVGLNTGTAGVYSGTAQFTGASHDAQLTDLQLATLGIAVSAQVNNYANAVFQLASGGGTLSRNGSLYTLDLGNLTQNSSDSSLLSVLNSVSGPADNFGGTFSYGSLTDISLNGANWSADSCSQSGYAFCLGAQGVLGGLGINVDTGGLGAFSDTIALNGMGFYQGASYSPYQQNLSLTVEGNIVAGGGGSVPEPGTLPLFAAGAALLLVLARRRRSVPGRGETK